MFTGNKVVRNTFKSAILNKCKRNQALLVKGHILFLNEYINAFMYCFQNFKRMCYIVKDEFSLLLKGRRRIMSVLKKRESNYSDEIRKMLRLLLSNFVFHIRCNYFNFLMAAILYKRV